MPVCIRASGTWRNATTVCINQSGTWRKVATGCIRSGGTWRNFGFGPTLGGAWCGGIFVCATPTARWVVAPQPTTVARTWYARNDASTVAQSVTGTTGWFIPDDGIFTSPFGLSQLADVRQYWGGYTFYPLGYWTCVSTPNAAFAWRILVPSNPAPSGPMPTSNGECKNSVTGVRAFKTTPL